MIKPKFLLPIIASAVLILCTLPVQAIDTTPCESYDPASSEGQACYDDLEMQCNQLTREAAINRCLQDIVDAQASYNPDSQPEANPTAAEPDDSATIASDATSQGQPGPCVGDDSFLGFPTWYKYLDQYMTEPECTVNLPDNSGFLTGRIPWLIGAAILEIVLRVAALVSVIFMVIGGYTILTSNGNPEGVSRGRNTIVAAIIGLVIAVMATSVVSFLADELSGGVSSLGEGLPQVKTDSGTGSVLLTIMNLLYRLAAGITVILVIISGINFATASGDPQQISKARNTIIYAAVGLVVTLLAVAIAGFVGGRL